MNAKFSKLILKYLIAGFLLAPLATISISSYAEKGGNKPPTTDRISITEVLVRDALKNESACLYSDTVPNEIIEISGANFPDENSGESDPVVTLGDYPVPLVICKSIPDTILAICPTLVVPGDGGLTRYRCDDGDFHLTVETDSSDTDYDLTIRHLTLAGQSCPEGEFLTGFDSSGSILCAEPAGSESGCVSDTDCPAGAFCNAGVCQCTDSDLDGVCDNDDTCPGANDNIDSDADGLPDACDPCPSDPNNVCNVDCGTLSPPTNGSVESNMTTYLGTATYTCFSGYGLLGNSTRTCQSDGSWSGAEPACTDIN